MRTLFTLATVALLAWLVSPLLAHAGSSCYQVGNNVYCNGDDGSSSSGYSVGNNQYYTGRDANGQSWSRSCYYVGTTRYCN